MKDPANRVQLSYHIPGTIVIVKTSFLNEPAGVRAYVYEQYEIGSVTGVSLITENGVDLGGFSIQDQLDYLVHDTDTGMIYVFKNVTQLDRDFEKHIKPLFTTNPQKNFQWKKPG